MDMTPQTAWLIAISAVVIVGVVAFFIGRSTAGTRGRIDELEAELSSKKAEVEGYRKEVEQHLDKTATLFVSMAGSYKRCSSTCRRATRSSPPARRANCSSSVWMRC